MNPPRVMFVIAALFALVAIAGVSPADAQMRGMGLPISTTIVISKPAPGEIYGDKTLVSMGVGQKKYKFILVDGYVDSMNPNTRWPDIWQYVRFHQPNFVVQGADADTFENVKPGEMLTVRGMFAPLDRTFEVMSVQQGRGNFAPEKHY